MSQSYSQNGATFFKIEKDLLEKIVIKDINKYGSGTIDVRNYDTTVHSVSNSGATITDFSSFTSGYVTICLYVFNINNNYSNPDFARCNVDLYLK